MLNSLASRTLVTSIGVTATLVTLFAGAPASASPLRTQTFRIAAPQSAPSTQVPHASQSGNRSRPGRAHPDMLVYHSYSFVGANGAFPIDVNLLDIGGLLYGTTSMGGQSNGGTIFEINHGLTSESVLHSFGQTLPDGALPVAGLVQKGPWLYGTAELGGSGAGTVFRIQPSGASYGTRWTFGLGNPAAALTTLPGRLWGTTLSGGGTGDGTIFNTNGNPASQTVCHHFSGSDGINPSGSLVHVGAYLYGTTKSGGAFNLGTVFKVNPINPTNCPLVWVYSFKPTPDGATPNGGLVKEGSTLYGTTSAGGSGYGTIFAVTNLNATTPLETVVYPFAPGGTNGTNGTTPLAELTGIAPNEVMGTTSTGGGSTNCANGCGTVFSYVLPSGPYTTVHSFQGFPDGSSPEGPVLAEPNIAAFFGTTTFGGTANNGTVFSLACPSCP